MNDLSMILFDNKMSMIEEERKHFAEMLQYEYRSSILNEDAEIIYEGIFESLMNFIKSIIDKIIGFFTSIINFITGKKKETGFQDTVKEVEKATENVIKYANDLHRSIVGDAITEDIKIFKIGDMFRTSNIVGALSKTLKEIPVYKDIQSLNYTEINKDTLQQTRNSMKKYYLDFLGAINIPSQISKTVVNKDGDKITINQSLLLKSISIKESIKDTGIDYLQIGIGIKDISRFLYESESEKDFERCRNEMKKIRSSLETSKRDDSIDSEKYNIVKRSFQIIYDFIMTCGSTWVKVGKRLQSMALYNAKVINSLTNKIEKEKKTNTDDKK